MDYLVFCDTELVAKSYRYEIENIFEEEKLYTLTCHLYTSQPCGNHFYTAYYFDIFFLILNNSVI